MHVKNRLARYLERLTKVDTRRSVFKAANPLKKVAFNDLALQTHAILTPFPLPIELWQQIFAYLSVDGRSHVPLSAVSRGMRSLLLPVYFRILSLKGRIQMERFLLAHEMAPVDKCVVRHLLLTGSSDVKGSTPEILGRSLGSVPFSVVYNRLINSLAHSLEHLTVTIPMHRGFGHTHLLPLVSFPCLHSFAAPAEAFNRHLDSNQMDPLPFMPALERLHLFGWTLDHDSFDILPDIVPNLKILRISYTNQEHHFAHDIGCILGIESYIRIRYWPSNRRLREAALRCGQPGLGTLDTYSPAVLLNLKVLLVDEHQPAGLENVLLGYNGTVRIIVSSKLTSPDVDATADWEDVVMGGTGPWNHG